MEDALVKAGVDLEQSTNALYVAQFRAEGEALLARDCGFTYENISIRMQLGYPTTARTFVMRAERDHNFPDVPEPTGWYVEHPRQQIIDRMVDAGVALKDAKKAYQSAQKYADARAMVARERFGFTTKEIAEFMGLRNTETVRTFIRRARKNGY